MTSSPQSGVLTLLHTACGAGILAMPFAFKPYGLVLGFFLITFCGFCSITGLLLQSYVSTYVPSRHASFFSLSQITYPALSVVFDFAIAIKCFGVGISYLVVVGDLLPQIMINFTSNRWLLDRNILISVCMLLVVTPLSFMRRLDSLKYASMVAVSSVAYLCVLVVTRFLFPSPEIEQNRGTVSFWLPEETSLGSMLSTFPIFVFAYTCHHNMFSIVNELRDNSIRGCVKVVTTSISLAVVLYVTIGGLGYLTFGNNITGNIITLYPQALSSTIGRVAILLLVMLAFPLQCHPARVSINHIWHYFTEPVAQPRELENSGLIRNEMSPTAPSPAYDISSEYISEEDPSTRVKLVPLDDFRFVIITTAILILSYLIAISVTSLARVLAIVGATGSTSISFILPGIFGYQLIGSEHHPLGVPFQLRLLKNLSLLLTIWGFFVMTICLTAALLFNASH
ncbi:HDL279Cp [Eremothecium sinecaudum]|uniref:HDL279Cp n=1 Tax=Eremothecium sinecaudum TaxID=45286 RepID=A0A0X8HS68_9SACH|nr:HDL279Cp [Eremothecium sinecaudum]AMD20465.1 HDL279Cp [Eremothecium sinecaudum]